MKTDANMAPSVPTPTPASGAWKFFVFSAIGIFVFFVPVSIGGTSSILLDHIVTWIRAQFPGAVGRESFGH
ncbi:hypothetical protein GLN3_00135 [Geobacillus lituanicus]|nr:hypothetical protein GLN3_00135 [Geobacillus lituanicus]